MMKASEILQKAHDVLVNKGWTRRKFARDAQGAAVSPQSLSATCFCAEGAIRHVSPDIPERSNASYYLASAIRKTHSADIWRFNYAYAVEKRDVLRKFRRAIQMAKKDDAAAHV